MNCAAELRDDVKRELTAEVVRRFGEARLKVTGTSMLPALWPGDEVTVQRQSVGVLLPGQVVLCYRDRAFTAHRVIAKRDGTVVTRGDSLSYDDPPFRDEEVVGSVVCIVRGGRPVAVGSAWWHPPACWMVQRSELCTRILLRLRRMRWAA